MMELGVVILLLTTLLVEATGWPWTTAFESCWSNCGYDLSSCSCSNSCIYNGNCCHDYKDYCYQTTDVLPSAGVGGSCGGFYTTSRGEFSSPRYPSSYPHYADCSWRIQSRGMHIISLTFSHVSMEGGSGCPYDGIRVYDGPSTSYRLLGTLCGTKTGSFRSSGNDLTVKFYSDGSNNGTGFYARWVFEEKYTETTEAPTEFTDITKAPSCRGNCGYTFSSCSCSSSCQHRGTCCYDYYDYCYSTTPDYEVTTAYSTMPCGGDLTNSRGEFSSPQYPYNYPSNSYCAWRLLASDREIVKLNFTDVELEKCCDWIRVYDGPTDSYPLLGQLLQDKILYFNSSRSYLYIVFSSDHSITRRGFRAEWTFAAQPMCNGKCGVSFSTCGCDYKCEVYGRCCHDYYEYCKYSTPSPVTAAPSCRWNCGSNLGSCSCSSSCMYYGNCCHDYYSYCSASTDIPTATHPSCGGSLFGSGSLSSPYYPNYYHDYAYCVWQLSAPAGQRIFLSFLDLELERCCNCDYINVHDGSSTASPLLAKLCNNNTLQDFHSSSSHMTVLFRSDSSGVARGFKSFFSSSLPEDRARVACSSENMTIVIRRSYLDSMSISWHNLYVDDHRCRPIANSYEVSFSFPVDLCGTNKTNNNGRVVYSNHVRAAPSQSGEITNQIDQFLLNVKCNMEQDTTVGNVYKAVENVNNTIIGTGHFNTSMAFYPSSSFSYPILESPYEVKLTQYVYVQVQLSRPDNTLDLYLDSCIASPNHDFQTRTYNLIQNGCGVDKTVHIYTNGQRYYAQFRFQAFKFLRTHSFVFLQCKVIVCADNDYNSRCRQGCRMRKGRSLDSTPHTDTVILGPITLKGAESELMVGAEE